MSPSSKKSGRGSASNPKNRFDALEYIAEPEDGAEEAPHPRTQFIRDDSQSLITYNKSPDVGFDASFNVYRGCEHGCAYCFARPSHEYLGMSAGLDFETRILVKERAPELLRQELSKKSWKPQVLAMSGVTDCYQPVERIRQLTRRCLAVLAEFRNPVVIITKNHLVTRDIDLLAELARFNAVSVTLSVTTLDGELAKKLEPRASSPTRRLAAIRELSAAGIPVRVLMAPVIPGLTDHEMPALLQACAKAGAQDAGCVPLRLPWAVAPLFEDWLQRHAPGAKEKVLGRIREMRGGKLYDSRWGVRMTGEGFYAEQIQALFKVAHLRAGFPGKGPPLSTASFRRSSDQLELFT
ncbi:PA0069 family radical SAM protein [Prosthecobacter sp.]|uniref:PA0069 family radical SAM protein n=1 Tax=Prosthecobacter sp. TaxID=1965333 RepID=UPI00378445F0